MDLKKFIEEEEELNKKHQKSIEALENALRWAEQSNMPKEELAKYTLRIEEQKRYLIREEE